MKSGQSRLRAVVLFPAATSLDSRPRRSWRLPIGRQARANGINIAQAFLVIERHISEVTEKETRMRSNRLHLALLVGLFLTANSDLVFSQNLLGEGTGPAPEPTPGQSISVGAGNLGGGIGAVPAPTPGQTRSVGSDDLRGGIGPLPEPTPGQSIERHF